MPPKTDGGLTYNAGTGQLTSTSILSNNILESYDGNTIEYVVTVASKTAAHPYNGTGSSSGYKIDGVESPFIEFVPEKTYKFNQDDNTNSGHPLRFYYDKDKTTAYTTNVTPNGTPGSSGAYTQIVVDVNTPRTLFYMCSTHGHMGNQVQVKGGDIVKTGTITSGTWNADTISIAKGGTGATTAAAARTALGLDSTVTNNSTDVTLGTVSNNYLTLSGQEITAGTVPISLGGTGATTAAAARTALGVDVAGTDNSTAVTLTNTDYLSISGQAITAGTVPISKGGTGLTSIGTAGQVLKVNSGASGLEWGTGGGSASEAFKTIAVAGQSDVVADSSTDTLTFEAGSNMTITTTPGSDKITFASSGGGSARCI